MKRMHLVLGLGVCGAMTLAPMAHAADTRASAEIHHSSRDCRHAGSSQRETGRRPQRSSGPQFDLRRRSRRRPGLFAELRARGVRRYRGALGFSYLSFGASATAGDVTSSASATYLAFPLTASYLGVRSGNHGLELGGGATLMT